MAKSAQQIEESLIKMRQLGKRLRLLFSILLALVCLCLAAVAAVALSMVADGSISDPSNTVSIVVPPLYLVICGAGAMVLRGISCDMAKGESPFTAAHARRIGALGWMLLAVAAIELIASPGFVSIVLGPLSLISSPHEMFEELTVPLDMGAVLGAIACFSIAAIWRYGALLQTQAEDLV